MRRLALCVLCALCALCAAAPAAGAESSDTLAEFPFYAKVEEPCSIPNGCTAPPGTGFEGPCGMAVDPAGAFYVADYYNDAVDAFASNRLFRAQLSGVDPLDGPCGLAVGSGGALYVEDFHGAVLRYTPSKFPLAPPPYLPYGAGTAIDPGPASGVAVDPASGDVYVDDRTYIAVYEPSGAPVEVGGEPLRIGLGSLEDGYGVAVSSYSATAGYVYVPDAASGTVKVYDPASDPAVPVAEIDGSETPAGGFVSLRDSAVAVDDVRGFVFLADDLQPEYSERPEAAIYAFGPSGAYRGRLKYNVVDALPPGLAVDNSETGTQGRIYVTSGNTEGAFVCAYAHAPESLTSQVAPPPCHAAPAGGSAAAAVPAAGAERPEAAAEEALAGASEIAQQGDLRVKVSGKLSPSALPRRGRAPVSVSLAGRVSEAGGGSPPQLRRLRIEFNRHGRLDTAGLPLCRAAQIQPASTARALAACRGALVGRGSFAADVVLSGQAPYPTKGTLLVFNGRLGGHAALLGQIYAAKPFATSFLIPFAIGHRAKGRWGTVLDANLPRALGNWGHITAIDLKLGRVYSYRGKRRGVLSAGCPAPKGFPGALFPLARMSFGFAGGKTLTSTLTRDCKARG